MVPSRLRGRKVVENVLRRGMLWKGRTFSVRWMQGAPRHPAADPAKAAMYVGCLASLKLDPSAVRRNRMRRRCREALRVALKERPLFGPVQLLIMPRSSSLTCDFTEIQKDISALLTVLIAWKSPKRNGSSSSTVSSSLSSTS